MMKRLTAFLIAIAIGLNLTGCGNGNPKPIVNTGSANVENTTATASNEDLNNYNINVELNPIDKFIAGQSNISYINNENIDLDKLYFHIYPNAYKREDTIPITPEDAEVAYSKGFKPGFIDILSVTSSGKSLQYNIEGTGDTILSLTLETPLKKGERINLSIGFKVTLPPVDDRLGYGDDCYNFGNWYPIAAVYDESGWNLDPYYAMGDPFYSDVSNYKVNITVPENVVVAATGNESEAKAADNKKVYTFEENSVRDFAWVASDKFKLDVEIVDGIQIKSYYLDEGKDRNVSAMNYAKESIKTFNKMYGKYPYKTFSIVATHFITGMEYPGLVFINKDYYLNNSDEFYLEVTIAHEAAHQWWYSVVGNDEVDEAWVDESLAAYSEVVYYENIKGREYGQTYMEHDYTEVYNDYKGEIQGGEVILKPVSEFPSLNDYAVLVYYKGAMMHNEIRKKVGDEVFFKILSTYYNKYKFKNATSQDYINVVEDVTGQQWDDFFDNWLLDK